MGRLINFTAYQPVKDHFMPTGYRIRLVWLGFIAYQPFLLI